MQSSQSAVYCFSVKYELITKDCQIAKESFPHKKREINISKQEKEAELEEMGNSREKSELCKET